jgi:hypothetical protein
MFELNFKDLPNLAAASSLVANLTFTWELFSLNSVNFYFKEAYDWFRLSLILSNLNVLEFTTGLRLDLIC